MSTIEESEPTWMERAKQREIERAEGERLADEAAEDAKYGMTKEDMHRRSAEAEAVLTVEETEGEPLPPIVETAAVVYADVLPQIVVRLLYPFEHEGRAFDTIELRPPAFGTVEATLLGRLSEIDMHAEMAGVSPAILRALRWPDLEAVTTAARHLAPALIQRRKR